MDAAIGFDGGLAFDGNAALGFDGGLAKDTGVEAFIAGGGDDMPGGDIFGGDILGTLFAKL